MQPTVYKQASNETTSSPFDFILSDESTDRMGDVILAKGWQLGNFRANPIALYGHDSSNLPVGRWKNVRISGKQLLGTLELAAQGTSAFIDTIRSLIEQKILKAVSVGFSPIEYEPIDDKQPWAGIKFTKQELHEVSVVAVPANANALNSKSLDPIVRRALAKSGAEPVDTFVRPKKSAEPGAKPLTIKGMAQMSIRDLIRDKRARIDELKASLEPLSELLIGEEGLDDAQTAEFDSITAELKTANAGLDRLITVQRARGEAAEPVEAPRAAPIGGGIDNERRSLLGAPAITLRTPKTGKDLKGIGLYAKMAAAQITSFMERRPLEAIVLRDYSGRDDLHEVSKIWAMSPQQRAAVAPAQTTVTGWATELVQQTYGEFLEDLKAVSVYAQLSSLPGSFRVNFDGYGKVIIPNRVRAVGATGDVAGAFFGEGKPIPVRRATFASQTLVPKEMGVITEFTKEMASRSTPAIEGLLRNAIITDTASAIDRALLDNVAVSAIRPAGLANGVTAITGSADADNETALRIDIMAALAPFIAGNAADGLAIMINPASKIAIALMTTALGAPSMFASQVNAGNLAGYPLIVSNNVATTDLWIVRATDFASATNDSPVFDVSEQATLHEDDGYASDVTVAATVLPIATGTAGAGVVATPVRSLFQTNSIALRMVLGMNWAMMRTGEVSHVTGITWQS